MLALIDRDPGAALAAIDGAVQAGRDAAGIATNLLGELRGVFPATMRADLSHLPDAERQRVERYAGSMPPARVTRAFVVPGLRRNRLRPSRYVGPESVVEYVWRQASIWKAFPRMTLLKQL